jgi:hypothetical protein
MFKHINSGKLYKCFGIIKHKDAITREWVDHVLYTLQESHESEEHPELYSRTKEDWDKHFKKEVLKK